MTNRENRVYIYGFNSMHRIVESKYLEGKAITVTNMRALANHICAFNPEVEKVVGIDGSYMLYKYFMETVKSGDYTKDIEFEDYVENIGIPIK